MKDTPCLVPPISASAQYQHALTVYTQCALRIDKIADETSPAYLSAEFALQAAWDAVTAVIHAHYLDAFAGNALLCSTRAT
jgi:hypothetical protein